MSQDTLQNDIRETLDQISLDFADGQYLNVVSSNLGIDRQLFGLSDDVWRAIVKTLAIQYKQIGTKFYDVLEILFGPQKLQNTDLVSDVVAGQYTIQVEDTAGFPQIGKIVLSAGLVTEETLDYCYIDRYTNTFQLVSPTQFAHSAPLFPSKYPVLGGSTGTLIIPARANFPTLSGLLPVVLNTPYGDYSLVADTTTATTTVPITTTLTDYLPTAVGGIETTLDGSVASGSYVLNVTNTSELPSAGVVKLGYVELIATGGSTTSAQFSFTNPLESEDMYGYVLEFLGDTTAALEGETRVVISNTTNSLVFETALPSAVAAGDTVRVYPVVAYTRVDYTDNLLILPKIVHPETLVSSGSIIELLEEYTLSTGTVQSIVSDWGVYETERHTITVYIPQELRGAKNLLDASYPHPVQQFVAAQPLAAGATAEDTSLVVVDSSNFLDTGVIRITEGGVFEYQTFVKDLDVANGLLLGRPLDNTYTVAAVVDIWQPLFLGTGILKGTDNDAVWPGPYVYSPDDPNFSSFTTTLTTPNLAAPTKIALDVPESSGYRAIEVEDASNWINATLPFEANIETEDGQVLETVTVEYVGLKSEAGSVTTANINISDTTVTTGQVDPPLGGTPDHAAFPDVAGYRIEVGASGGDSSNSLFVVDSISAPNVFNTENAATAAHSSGVNAVLKNDLIVLSAAPTQSLTGVVDYADRLLQKPTYLRTSGVHVLRRLYDELTVTLSTGSLTAGGTILINHGASKSVYTRIATTVTARDITMVVEDSSIFPTTYPFFLRLDEGTKREEIVVVTNNNTGTNTLTLENGADIAPPRSNHPIGSVVRYVVGEEAIPYDTVNGNDVSFSSPIMLQSNHAIGSKITFARGLSVPPDNGLGYPLRVPSDLLERIRVLFDLIRAAGIKLEFVDSL